MTDRAKTMARRAVTGLLLAFVAASVVVLVAQEIRRGGAAGGGPSLAGPGPASSAGDSVLVVYFHRTARCVTCRTIEAVAKRTVESDFAAAVSGGRLAWRLINLDAPGNERYADDFELSAQSVVLVEMRGGRQGRWKNLEKVWDYTDDEAALAGYIRTEIEVFLRGS